VVNHILTPGETASNQEAITIRALIASNIQAGEKVYLDFADIATVTSGWLGVAIMSLMDEFSPDEIRTHLILIGMGKQPKNALARAFQQKGMPTNG